MFRSTLVAVSLLAFPVSFFACAADPAKSEGDPVEEEWSPSDENDDQVNDLPRNDPSDPALNEDPEEETPSEDPEPAPEAPESRDDEPADTSCSADEDCFPIACDCGDAQEWFQKCGAENMCSDESACESLCQSEAAPLDPNPTGSSCTQNEDCSPFLCECNGERTWLQTCNVDQCADETSCDQICDASVTNDPVDEAPLSCTVDEDCFPVLCDCASGERFWWQDCFQDICDDPSVCAILCE